jgi:hypothetical protein
MSSYQGPPEEQVSGTALGVITFAACMLILIGIFHAIAGLSAIVDDKFYVVAHHYTFQFDTTTWGWIHLILGALLAVTGFGLFGRQAWAGVTAIVLVSLSAIANFFFIPYYPLWSIVLIAIDVWVIWALTRPGAIRT